MSFLDEVKETPSEVLVSRAFGTAIASSVLALIFAMLFI